MLQTCCWDSGLLQSLCCFYMLAFKLWSRNKDNFSSFSLLISRKYTWRLLHWILLAVITFLWCNSVICYSSMLWNSGVEHIPCALFRRIFMMPLMMLNKFVFIIWRANILTFQSEKKILWHCLFTILLFIE